MSDDKDPTLAQRLRDHPRWQWMTGMVICCESDPSYLYVIEPLCMWQKGVRHFGSGEIRAAPIWPDTKMIPDLESPSTVGCLRSMVHAALGCSPECFLSSPLGRIAHSVDGRIIARGLLYIWDTLHTHPVRLATDKPPAHLTLDDRGVLFDGPGTFPTLDAMAEFKPWWRK